MYKTIVVHVDGSVQQASRLRAAAQLANDHGAHLVGCAATGISWMDFALLTGYTGAPVPRDDFTAMREAADAWLRAFTGEAVRLGVGSVEARLAEDIADYALLLQSRYADLVVLSRDSGGAAETPAGAPARMRDLPERVSLYGVRPVLLIPEDWQEQALPGTAVAGWDGGLCALRAIAAALPLLQRADSVKLTLVNPDRMADLHGEQPGADMALYLARHGVKVDVMIERTNATAGAALMGLARDCRAGLMVTGAYGHSRFREWVLGGVTRELLERAPVPLLLAH
jgi:nucleotide-binding universal stress UspA family protein